MIFPVGISRVGFQYRSVAITACGLPDVVFGNEPNMSVATNLSGQEAVNC